MAGPAARWRLVYAMVLVALEATVRATEAAGAALSRQKRYLVFPEGASLQVVYEFLIPTVNERPFLMGWTLGIAYPLPTEAKQVVEKFKPIRTTTEPPMVSPPAEMHYYHDWDGPEQPLMIDGSKHWGAEEDNDLHTKHRRNRYFKGYSGYALPHEVRLHRRHRRDLYLKLESLLSGARVGGRACVLRALCEEGQRRTREGKGRFLAQLLSVLFTFPPNEDGGNGESEDEYLKEAERRYDAAHSTQADCQQLFPQCTASIFELCAGDRLPA